METKRRFFFPMIILTLGLLLFICLIGIFFSLKKTTTTNDSATTISSVSYNIYFLSLNSSSIESQATELGKDQMINDFSGYIWKNEENFYCLASAYENENDAILVKKKLEKEGIYSEIFKISFPSVQLSSSYSAQERQTLFNALNSFHEIYCSLYDISISLDNKLNNETGASLAINSVLAKFENILNDYKILFSRSENNFINTISRYLFDMHESLSLLKEKIFITPTQTFSSLIKYRYCESLDLNYNLILEIDSTEI